MTQWIKKQLGITLLEVLLVLAIASMIIVMSIRYYQSAVGSQGANSILEEMQAVTAAMDSLATASGSYANVQNPGSLVQNSLGLPNNSVTINGATASSYTVSLQVNTSGTVCNNLTNQIASNGSLTPIYTGVACGNGTVSYTYQETT